MALSKPLIAALAVLLVAGGGVAATGVAQTGADASTASGSVSALEMDATLDDGTVTVTVADDGTPVENASVTVEGDEDVRVTTDANGTATVDRSALTADGESLDELEVEYESDHVEGKLEFVVRDGSLTLVEEKYEYEVEYEDDEEDGEESEDEEEDGEESEDEEEDGEESEDDEEDGEESEDDEEDGEENENDDADEDAEN
jgi:hypothetical protein